MRTIFIALLIAASSPACDNDYGEGTFIPPDNAPPGNDDDDEPSGPDSGTPDEDGTTIRIAATSIDTEVPFMFSTTAAGSDRFGDLSITAPTGTATYGGEPYRLYVYYFEK